MLQYSRWTSGIPNGSLRRSEEFSAVSVAERDKLPDLKTFYMMILCNDANIVTILDQTTQHLRSVMVAADRQGRILCSITKLGKEDLYLKPKTVLRFMQVDE